MTTDLHLTSTFFLSLIDASDPQSIKDSARLVGSEVGAEGLNLLVNNAGYLTKGNIQESTIEDMQDNFRTNLLGPMLMIKVRERKSVVSEAETFSAAFSPFTICTFKVFSPPLLTLLLLLIIRSSCLTCVQQ